MSEQFKNEPLLDRLTSALYSERGTYTATNAGADYYARKGRRIQNEKKLLEKFRECYEELTPIGDDYSPTDAHLAAQAQGFRNSREWEQSWREAFKILYELEAGRKPNTCEIKLINDTHDNNTYIGKWDGFF